MMKKIHTLFTVLLLLSALSGVYAQYSFEKTISTTDSETFYGVFEDIEHNYICIGGKKIEGTEDNLSPFVVKFSSEGNVLDQFVYSKVDTAFVFRFGFQKANGNYFFIGTLNDSMNPGRLDHICLCEMNQSLQILQEKYYEIPEPFHSHTIDNYLMLPDQQIIVEGRADSSLYGYNDALVLWSFDMEGNLLNFNMPENWKDYDSRGDIINKVDGSGFYLIGSIGEYSFPRDWVAFDYNLNLINYGDIEDNLSYMATPLSLKRLSNGNFFMANASWDLDLEIRILDQEFNLVSDTLMYYDYSRYLPVHDGVDFTNENNIWLSVFEAKPTWWPGTEEFHVHVFDSTMRLKGSKTYGGHQRSWLFDLTATSDGGCIIVGMVPDFEGSNSVDAYMIKIMPEDILTGIEEFDTANEMIATIYPNPFHDFISLESNSTNIKFSLSTIYGQEAMVSFIPEGFNNTIRTSDLKPGIYFFTIKNDEEILQSGKLIKN